MVRGILLFLWLASFWVASAADRAAAQTLPDGCPDIQGTYFCDGWSLYHQIQFDSHFQSFERIPDPDPVRNRTIYKISRWSPGYEDKKTSGYGVADGEKKERTTDIWGNKDHAITKCEDGTLDFYSEVDIHKTRISWYFKGDTLVKKFYKESRYWGRVLEDRTYPCKNIEGHPEAAAACNNHWCSWSMDQEKQDCYDRLCRQSKKNRFLCFKTNCDNNDWSKPTARSTALDRLDEAVEERKTKTDTPHDVAPAP